MKKIQQLSDHIKEEIEDACTYIDEALMCKEDNREVADLYCRLAEEELTHMGMLHKQVVREIENYRRTNGDPPPVMQARYDILHEIHTADANRVRLKIQLYKEG
jgi:Mn-containing catalase